MRKTVAAILLAFALLTACVHAEGMISASVQIQASRNVYDSVIRPGESVDIKVDISGFTPHTCQWYREELLLEGETGDTLHIASATIADSGFYRMDALDSAGQVRVSADVALRVVDQAIPKTGDSRPSVPMIACMMLLAAATLFLPKKKVHNQQKSS